MLNFQTYNHKAYMILVASRDKSLTCPLDLSCCLPLLHTSYDIVIIYQLELHYLAVCQVQ